MEALVAPDPDDADRRSGHRARENASTRPVPARASRLTRPQIIAALKRAGRKRGIEAEAERLREAFRQGWTHQPPLVEDV
ncbi:hypothetical protein ACFRCG_02950 [Embleya sp. NPDC056575]|uniref:hypothetical protein n=1 Tax=unclassified Embleya TaxID=2699296 RepID=UPI0036A69417